MTKMTPEMMKMTPEMMKMTPEMIKMTPEMMKVTPEMMLTMQRAEILAARQAIANGSERKQDRLSYDVPADGGRVKKQKK